MPVTHVVLRRDRAILLTLISTSFSQHVKFIESVLIDSVANDRLTAQAYCFLYQDMLDHSARNSNGRSFRILNILDEYSRECLACVVERQITSQTELETLYELFSQREIAEHIRSDNGSEFTADAVRKLLADLRVRTLFIERIPF
jgi:transposase InsO family protein